MTRYQGYRVIHDVYHVYSVTSGQIMEHRYVSEFYAQKACDMLNAIDHNLPPELHPRYEVIKLVNLMEQDTLF